MTANGIGLILDHRLVRVFPFQITVVIKICACTVQLNLPLLPSHCVTFSERQSNQFEFFQINVHLPFEILNRIANHVNQVDPQPGPSRVSHHYIY